MFFLLRFLLQGHETSQVRKELSSDRKEVESFVGLMEAVTQASNEASGMVLTDARRRHFNNMIRSQEIVLTSKLRNLQVEEEAWLSLKMKFMNKDLFRSSSICVVDRNDELRKDDEEVDEGNFEFDDEFEEEEKDQVSEAFSGDVATLVGQNAVAERRVQALALGLDQIGVSPVHPTALNLSILLFSRLKSRLCFGSPNSDRYVVCTNLCEKQAQ